MIVYTEKQLLIAYASHVWDIAQTNEANPSIPLKVADHIVGSWNRFRILMVEDRVHVFLNGELVVRNTVLENYWDRKQPIFRTGSVELQNHGNNLWFRNIYIREINTPEPKPPAKTKKLSK